MSPSIPNLTSSLLLLVLSADLLALHFVTLCAAGRMDLSAGFSYSLLINGTRQLGVVTENDGVFLPILSTSSFTNGTVHGFSFGMLAANYRYPYLCVCRGQMLETSSKGTKNQTLYDVVESSFNVTILSDSTATPIWTVRSLLLVNASLMVTQDNALELRDVDGSLVWNVTNVAAMEILESGNLVIYNSTNDTIWQSFDHPRDTLLKGQQLTMSMKLTSNDSVYSMALEPRGCNGSFEISLYSRNSPENGFAIDFLRLENDGLFHAYRQSGIFVVSVDTVDKFATPFDNVSSPFSRYDYWHSCGVPMACGPYSVCSPAGEPCECPQSQSNYSYLPFEPLVYNNEGCSSPYDLSGRGMQEDSVEFLEMGATSTILFISGAKFNIMSPTPVDCKNTCRSNRSCVAVFSDMKSNSCFPISTGISLLDLRNIINPDVDSANYVTYLKIVVYNSSTVPANDSITRSSRFRAGVAVVSVLLFLALAALALYGRSVLKKRRAKGLDKVELLRLLPSLPTRFSYRELRTATQGFSKLLGAGGFGSVYVGALSDGRQIAVKTLDIIVRGDMSRQFLAEVATIGQTSHCNVVQLIGFCWKTSHQLLVYEYMEKGSLDGWIFNVADGGQVLDWATRFHVVIGIARGLTYLHEECIQPILHLDIKPQNILLDPSFEPKLADFGMSRFIARDVSQVATVARGTPGYIAPELLFSEGAVSKKCDVYSLGMVLLEIVGGRRNVDVSLFMQGVHGESIAMEMRTEEWHFPTWVARMYEEGKTLDVVDKRLNRAFSSEEATRTIEVALWCIQGNPSSRPSAGAVSKWLEGATPLDQPPVSSIAHTQSRVKLSISHGLEASASSNPILSSDIGKLSSQVVTSCRL